MWRFLILFLLWFAAFGCQNGKATPPTTGAAPSAYPTIMVLPTLTPVPLTDPALAAFKQQLKAAFDARDGDKLRDTISFSKWVASIYRQGGTMPIDPQRGLELTLQFLKENDLLIDAERETYEPNWSVNDADTAEFVVVSPKNGSPPYFAHLLITHEPGGWRYTGIVTRLPYYDAPSLVHVRANPSKYQGREYMYVGTYAGKENPPTAAGAAPAVAADADAFILNTFAGPLWVTMKQAPYVYALDPNAAARVGQPVRVFGTFKLQAGAPYLEADSVEFIAPSDHGSTHGVVQAVDEKTRRVTLQATDNGAATLYLSSSSFVALPDGGRGKFSDVKVGQTVDALGVPERDGTLRVQELYIAK